MSTTARKIRKREHHLALASYHALEAADQGQLSANAWRAPGALLQATAWVSPREDRQPTKLIERPSFLKLSERRQTRELQARGKTMTEALAKKLAALRPERPEPTRIRGRR